MAEFKIFSPPIPDNHITYEDRINVAGTQHRIGEVHTFIKGPICGLELEREHNNKHDKNAIKVIGLSKGWFFIKESFIGYIPRYIAEKIINDNVIELIKPSIKSISVDDEGFVGIEFQLIGPHDDIQKYITQPDNSSVENDPTSSPSQEVELSTPIQKEFYRFFKIKVPRKLTYEEARKTINLKRMELVQSDNSTLEDWGYFEDIFEEFDDYDFRETYDIKKVSAPLLKKAIQQLTDEGNTMELLSDEIDLVVDRIIKIDPKKERT